MKEQFRKQSIILDFRESDNGFEFASDIQSSFIQANDELQGANTLVEESIETLRKLTPECDKYDYMLAACSGALCGIFDIFLVGKPGESPVGNITDKWFEERVKDFARLSGWQGKKNNFPSALRYLENKFNVPYDQTGTGTKIGENLFDLTPKNHHFKSLAHNPTILGLFCSVLDQFSNTSHFVTKASLVYLLDADDKFELQGTDAPSKLFCAAANWIGHLISDMSGANGSKGRGMGIPSPFWCWSNDIISIKQKCNIPVSEFNKSYNEFALQMYLKGYDARFQAAQVVPVFVNEMIVRLIYSIRRMMKFFLNRGKEERSFISLWNFCNPFSNVTVKRMLSVAHGTFCLLDIGDAAFRGYTTCDASEFFMRLNIIGIGRLSFSLYGEFNLILEQKTARDEIYFRERELKIVKEYISGLKTLADSYADQALLTFIRDFEDCELYKEAFGKSVLLAEKRNVPEDKILRTKTDIDSYFGEKQ